MYIFKSVYHACLGLVGKLFVLDELKFYVPKKLNNFNIYFTFQAPKDKFIHQCVRHNSYMEVADEQI